MYRPNIALDSNWKCQSQDQDRGVDWSKLQNDFVLYHISGALNNDITWQYPHHAQYFYRSIVIYFFESLNVFSFSFQKTGPLRSLQRQQMSAVSGEPPGFLQPLSQWGRAGVHSGWTVGRNDPRVPAASL